jgi:branched-subunit amino acid aminotransferase/4-amino-4-deoxychorismate lyase
MRKYDECFVTATGWGICSVKSINRKIFYNRNKTKKIQEKYSKLVGINIVNQYLNFLNV